MTTLSVYDGRDLLACIVEHGRILYESAVEMQAVADGLFGEAKRLVDEMQDAREGRPLRLLRAPKAKLTTRPGRKPVAGPPPVTRT